MATGGDALAVGIWYQTLGAAAAIGAHWNFKGGAGASIHGDSDGLWPDELRRLLLEYFDMDAGIRNTSGIQFIQFKVTSQQTPSPFTPDEVRDILRNATLAILKHQAGNSEPITGFVVATNRPIGRFALLESAVNNPRVDVYNHESFASFEESPAPIELFPSNKKSETEPESDSTEEEEDNAVATARTMRDLAKSITRNKPASEWGFTFEERTAACLKAMALFAFADAHPAKLRESLRQWLNTWGILPTEYDRYTAAILGALQVQSVDGSESDELSIMRLVLGSPEAVPITAKHIWKSVVEDLRGQNWPDPPTPYPIGTLGIRDWMLDRSGLLQGLPYDFFGSVPPIFDPDDPSYGSTLESPRIFVLVGDGGTGKSILMAQILVQVAGTHWDWQANAVQEKGVFIGCPIFRAAEVHVLEAIANSLKKWGGRREELDQPAERIAIAYGVGLTEPAVWFGVDGLDEISNDQLMNLARTIANYTDNHPNVRFLLSSRPDQFDRIKKDLNGKRLAHSLEVREFTVDEAREAVLKATEQHLRLNPRPDSLLGAGTVNARSSVEEVFQDKPFEDSMRQPLFIGVVHRVYKKSGIEMLQRAHDGDPDGLLSLAREYMYDYCERAQRRLNKPNVTARKVFKAIKQLAIEIDTPPIATRSYWISVCERFFDDHVKWNELYDQCVSSGLIRWKGGGAFEWRHPLVSKNLPNIEENPEWL